MKYILLFLLLLTTTLHSEESKLSNAAASTLQIFNSSITSIIDGLKATKDVAVKEVPLIVREYLKWNLIKSIVSLIFCLFLWTVFLFIVKAMFKWSKSFKVEIDGAVLRGGISFSFFILTLVFAFSIKDDLTTILQISYAPKIYLIENLIKLVK